MFYEFDCKKQTGILADISHITPVPSAIVFLIQTYYVLIKK